MDLDWDIPELTLWDRVPASERICDAAYVHLIAYTDPKYQYWLKAVCGRPWCSKCEKMRLWRYRNRIASYVKFQRDVGTNHWWFLTRSIRNSHNPRIAFEEFLSVKRKFHNHRAQAWHPFNRVTAWVGMLEITFSRGEGYNLHQHLLLGTHRKNDVSRVRIVQRWDNCGPTASSMTHLKRMTQAVGAIAYLTKYISKGTWGGLSRGRAYEIRASLKGRNRFQVMPATAPPREGATGFVICCSPLYDGDCQQDVHDNVILHGSLYEHPEGVELDPVVGGIQPVAVGIEGES